MEVGSSERQTYQILYLSDITFMLLCDFNSNTFAKRTFYHNLE